MSPTMRLDDDIWEHLKKNSSFVDTPSDVLRRLLNLPKPTRSGPRMHSPNGSRNVLQADRDYANVPITSYEFKGKSWQVRTYKDVLMGMCEALRSQHGDQFDNLALTLHGKKRSYFSRANAGMKHPKQVAGRGGVNKDLYVESNLSATSIMGLCQYLVRTFAPQEAATFRIH